MLIQCSSNAHSMHIQCSFNAHSSVYWLSPKQVCPSQRVSMQCLPSSCLQPGVCVCLCVCAFICCMYECLGIRAYHAHVKTCLSLRRLARSASHFIIGAWNLWLRGFVVLVGPDSQSRHVTSCHVTSDATYNQSVTSHICGTLRLRTCDPFDPHTHTHIHTHAHTHTHTHAHTHSHTHTNTRTHAHKHAHTRSHTHTHTHIYTHTHTYTHAHSGVWLCGSHQCCQGGWADCTWRVSCCDACVARACGYVCMCACVFVHARALCVLNT